MKWKRRSVAWNDSLHFCSLLCQDETNHIKNPRVGTRFRSRGKYTWGSLGLTDEKPRSSYLALMEGFLEQRLQTQK